MAKSIGIIGFVAAGGLLAISGCALRAQTDYDSKALIASCHRYTFADAQTNRPEAATAFGNPLNEKRLREAIGSNLVAHGVTAAPDMAAADCSVGYAIGSRLATDAVAPRFGWGFGWGGGWGGWGRRGWGGSLAWESPYNLREGRVTVDLFDAHSHQALWHAYVDADVTGLTGVNAEQRIKAVVQAIFEKFPMALTTPGAIGSKS